MDSGEIKRQVGRQAAEALVRSGMKLGLGTGSTAIEAVRREPLSERTQEISFRIGLALVLLLFVFTTVIDVRRWVG
jgi:ribose 5-phosphate isomerase